jgi:ribosomal protein S21
MWRRIISTGVSALEGESQDCLLRRFQRMVPMSGIVRRAESRRHFPDRDYEIKQKEEHYYEDLCG